MEESWDRKKKSPRFLPTYIKRPHSGCQSAADILHKFRRFQERRAQTRLSRRCSRAPDLSARLSLGRKSPSGLQVSSNTFKRKTSSLVFNTVSIQNKEEKPASGDHRFSDSKTMVLVAVRCPTSMKIIIIIIGLVSAGSCW